MVEILIRGDRGPGRIVIVGNSHRHALYAAWDGRDALGVEADNIPVAVSMVSGARLCPGPDWSATDNQEYWHWAIREATGQNVVVTWQGNQHNRFLFRVAANFDARPFGFVVDEKKQRAPLIPFALAEAFFRASLDYEGVSFEDILHRLRAAKRVFVLGTPPPKSNETTLSNLGQEAGYAAAAKAQGIVLDDHALTPVATRVALWQSLQFAMEKVCAKAGTEFVEVPPEAFEFDGCLKSRYCEQDATHGNAAFGALMWKEVTNRLHTTEAMSKV